MTMNAILTAIHRIANLHIPKEILAYGLRNTNGSEANVSIDDLLLRRVIRPIVIADMDLYGAKEINIPVAKCKLIYSGVDGFTVVVPKTLTNDRDIVSVNEVLVGDPYTRGVASTLGGCADTGSKLLNNLSAMNVDVTADATVIGTNTIFINKYFPDLSNIMITCIIDNDAALNNLSTRSYDAFTELVLYATQAFIYNDKRLVLHTGKIEYGHNLDVYKDTIYEWADAAITYKEFFKTKWKKISYMNDKHRRKKLVSGMFGNNM